MKKIYVKTLNSNDNQEGTPKDWHICQTSESSGALEVTKKLSILPQKEHSSARRSGSRAVDRLRHDCLLSGHGKSVVLLP